MNYKFIKIQSLALSFLSLSSVAHAGSTTAGGVISNVIMQPSGQMFFDVAAAHVSRPGCATTERWVIDTSKPGGQAAAAAALTAFANKRPITVQGNGTCDVWPDTETIAYFLLPN